MHTPPLHSRFRPHPLGPLRLFPRDPDPPATEAGALRGRLRVNGHAVTVLHWRRQPPSDVADAIRLDCDLWIALRLD